MTIEEILEECKHAVQCGIVEPMRYPHAPRYVRFKAEGELKLFCPLTLAYYRCTGIIVDTGCAMEVSREMNISREVATKIIWSADNNPGQLNSRMLAMFNPAEIGS